MKKYTLFSLAMMALVAAGCQNETMDNEFQQEQDGTNHTEGMTLRASAFEDFGGKDGKGKESRVAFNENGQFFWTEGDVVGVVNIAHNSLFTPMKIVKGAGTGEATFQSEEVGTMGKYAIYPYTGKEVVNGNTLSVTLPRKSEYWSKDGRVDTDFFVGPEAGRTSFSPSMYAEINGGQAAFKHLGGVMCVHVQDLGPGRNDIILHSDETMTGSQDVDLTDAEPMLTNGNFNKNTSNYAAIIYYNEGENPQTSGVFYFPLAVGEYHNVRLTHTRFDGPVVPGVPPTMTGEVNKDLGTVTVNRRSLKRVEMGERYIAFSETGTNKASRIVGPFADTHDVMFTTNARKILCRYNYEPAGIDYYFLGEVDSPAPVKLPKNQTTEDLVYPVEFKDGTPYSEMPVLGVYTFVQDHVATILVGRDNVWNKYTWLGDEVILPITIEPKKPLDRYISKWTPKPGGSSQTTMTVANEQAVVTENVQGNDVKASGTFEFIDKYDNVNQYTRINGNVNFYSVAWLYSHSPRLGFRSYKPLSTVERNPMVGTIARTAVWEKANLGSVLYFKMHYAKYGAEYEASAKDKPESTFSKDSYVPTGEYSLSSSSSLVKVTKDSDGYYKLSITRRPQSKQKVTLTYKCGTYTQVFTILFPK